MELLISSCELMHQDDEASCGETYLTMSHRTWLPAVRTRLKREHVLTLHQNGHQGALEGLLGTLHLLLMLRLLAHQPPDVAVGRLDHGVEVIGCAAVDLSPINPGEQHRRGLAELMVICGET